jgi:hypothetical protein
MKTKVILLIIASALIFTTCKKDDEEINGDQSPMGEVGTRVTSTVQEVAGVRDIEAEVVSLDNGVSTYTGSAKVTNTAIKNILSNFSKVTINGDVVTVTDIQFKSTTEGIEAISGLSPGVLVKYDSKVGDTYPLKLGGEREVVSKSTEDDYNYGFWLIKVMKIEEHPNKMGIQKITYWANHKFGLVGIEFTFDDGSTAKYPVYNSTENG